MDDWKRSFHTAERDVNLEPSERLTPLEALNMYRSRATVEHLAHFPKYVAGLKPLRVWKEDSIGDAILLALLAENSHRNGRIRDGDEEVNQGEEGQGIRTGMPPSHRIHGVVAGSFDSYPFDREKEDQEGPFQQLRYDIQGGLLQYRCGYQ